MKILSTIISNNNLTELGYATSDESIESLIESRMIDSLLVSTEGLSSLPDTLSLSEWTGQQRELFLKLQRIVRSKQQITLCAISGLGPTNKLKAVVLCPSERSWAYRSFAVPDYGKPYHDFYYNVTFYAVLAAARLGGKKIGMTHLTGGGRHFSEYPEIAAVSFEAVDHYCNWDDYPSPINSFSFVGCCIEQDSVQKAIEMYGGSCEQLITSTVARKHRPNPTTEENIDGATVIYLDLEKNFN